MGVKRSGDSEYGYKQSQGEELFSPNDYDYLNGNLDANVTDEWIEDVLNLSDDELRVLEEYQLGSTEINNFIRYGDIPTDIYVEFPDEVMQEKVDTLLNIIESSKTDKDLVLYRGIGEVLDDSQIGSDYNDPAFLSTSTNIQTADDFAQDYDGTVLEILYPKGSPGLPVGQTLENNGLDSQFQEHEVLLPAYSDFRIIGSREVTYMYKSPMAIKNEQGEYVYPEKETKQTVYTLVPN